MTYDPILPRARIGFIIPASNRMVEPQMARSMPSGVVPHFTRVRMHEKNLGLLMPKLLDAASLLADSKCDITVLQCTGLSMSGGVDGEKEAAAAIRAETGRPAISAASSVTAALTRLGARKLVFLSESEQEGHDKKCKFLREAGYTLLADKAVSLAGTDAYCTAPPALWYDTAVALKCDEADAIFISCANIHSIDIIEDLERRLNKPVVTSNQAALWLALRMIGIEDLVPGLGRLLTLSQRMGAPVTA
jgi:maleate isomerase